MNRHEQKIVSKLSTGAAQPRPEFVASLKSQLIESRPLAPKKGFNMFSSQVYGIIGSLMVIALVGTLLFMNYDDEADEVAVTDQVMLDDSLDFSTPESSSMEDSAITSLGLSLPTTQYDSLEEASKAVSFSIVTPSIKIGDEELNGIQSFDSPAGDGSQTLELNYGSDDQPLYRLSQGEYEGYIDETAKKVTITFNGKSTSARLASFESLDDPSGNPISFDGGPIARSLLSWSANGITYELSEFGELSQAELSNLAESLR